MAAKKETLDSFKTRVKEVLAETYLTSSEMLEELGLVERNTYKVVVEYEVSTTHPIEVVKDNAHAFQSVDYAIDELGYSYGGDSDPNVDVVEVKTTVTKKAA